jgi:AAA domain-containing protein
VHGDTGRGKTCATANLAVRLGAGHVTELPFWGPLAMVGKICEELNLKPLARCAPMFDAIARELTMRPRPLFVDESDCIADQKKLVETLRILHDLTAVPLILIGMGEFRAKVKRRPQLERRILREAEFRPSTLADSRLMASELAEVKLADDLVEVLHRQEPRIGRPVRERAGARADIGSDQAPAMLYDSPPGRKLRGQLCERQSRGVGITTQGLRPLRRAQAQRP